jgi:archaemetzincin
MIEVVTIGAIPEKLLSDLLPKLETIFSPLVRDCLLGASLRVPSTAYNDLRKQYDANIILGRLSREAIGGNKVLALTKLDLYTSSCNLNFIFVQAQCPGRVALVSLHRLNPVFYGQSFDYKLLLERTIKESVHELGHTFGLSHCSNPKCVMSFSNSIVDVDNKRPVFCENCKGRLR